MRVLLDTNTLLRFVDKSDRRNLRAVRAIAELWDAGHQPVLVPQSIYEFWTAATRTREANGMEMSVDGAKRYVDDLLSEFAILPDRPELPQAFIDLVARHNVTGTNAYDARLAAAMLTHGVTHLLTFNAKDFRRLGIEVIEP